MQNTASAVCKYDFHTAIQKLNSTLQKEQPKNFNPFWVKTHAESVYKYLHENVQTATGDIDWDFVTINLDPIFQKRWKWLVTGAKSYEDRKEINIIFSNYQDKLYTLIAPIDKNDKIIQDRIVIQLVRLAQKGNLLAKQQVMDSMTFIIYEWIENSQSMMKWKSYTNEIHKKIESCIRNYRYSGSFMKYIFMTFYYSARGLRTTCSLNDRIGKRNNMRIDYVIQENDADSA